MGRDFAVLIFIAFGALGVPAYGEVHFTGYLKNYTIAQDEIDNDLFQFDRNYRMQNSGRFMLDIFNGNQVWQLHYEAGVDSSSELFRQAIVSVTPQRQGDRLTDIRPIIGSDDRKTTLPQNLDRMNVQFQLQSGDLTIGRQAITFGSARIINPTDVFLPFDVRTLNTEYRTGIDAIRFQKPMGQLAELDMGIVFGDGGRGENSSAFVQLLTNLDGRDYQFTAMRFSEQNLLGVGVQSALGELGFWFEAAVVTGDESYTRASIGLDYAFSENVFGMVEYHFNGAGSNNPEDYLLQQNDIAYRAGGVFLLGKNYLIPTLSWQVSTLLNLSVMTLANLDDDSLFISFNGDYSLADNLYMGVGYYLFTGDGFTGDDFSADDFTFSSQSPIENQLQLASEYGVNPNSFFASLRYYF